MKTEELRAIQAPIKERYKEHPDAALITLSAHGRLGEGVTCNVQTWQGTRRSRVASGNGGNGLSACSGDMLLQALVGPRRCEHAVATAIGVVVQSGAVRAEGDLDFRGTLGVAKDAAVGLTKRIRLYFDLEITHPNDG